MLQVVFQYRLTLLLEDWKGAGLEHRPAPKQLVVTSNVHWLGSQAFAPN